MASKAILRVKEFRGSTRDFVIPFDSKKSLTLVYGENGSGKTTICDAFDFIGNGKVGSLENRGLGQLHPYWPTLGKSGANILVEFTVGKQTWLAQANSKSVSTTPVTPGVPKIEVLRRASILRLVQEAPKERYDALGPFIDIALVEQAEASLKSQIRDTRGAQNDAASRISENRESLERLWKESGAAGKDSLTWALAEVSKPPKDASSEVQSLRDAIRAIEALIGLIDIAAKASDDVVNATTAAASAISAQQQIEAGNQSADAVLIQILSAAREHFQSHEVGAVCPLCQSSEKIEQLAERVDERLSSLKKLADARRVVDATKTELTSKQSSLASLQSRAQASAKAAIEKISKTPESWSSGSSKELESIASVSDSGDIKLLDIPSLQISCDRATQTCAALEGQNTWYKSVKAVFEQYEHNFKRQEATSRILPKLDQALGILEKQRKDFLGAILSAIAKDVGRLYEIIHPGEGMNKISLKLDPKKAGSLDLAAEFLSKTDIPPHAYFSESHLDSLGLCIFMALAALSGPKETFVVMDDVLGSIDEPHVDRVIEMLYSESKQFKHMVVTTHYLPWREKFRWGWLKNGQCELIELGVWDKANGICTRDLTRAPLVELRQHLAQSPPSLQSACASAGVMLEAICDYLTALYECDAPRRKGKLTLGDLLPRITGKLKDSLRVEVKQSDGSYNSIPLKTLIDQLQQMAQLRNIFGCHFNDLSMHLPGGDALKFSSLVEEVATALICDEEGWPGSDKSGSYWATRDETRRLHPLKKPK